MSTTVVITDTSVLINFLVIDRLDLFTQLPGRRFVLTEHVRVEITEHFEEQKLRLESAFEANILNEIRVEDFKEVQLFATLTATGLGIGECSAIAAASHRKHELAIDDKRAVKKLESLDIALSIHSTESLIILLIKEGVMTIAEADAIKFDWEQNHRFRLPFQSFSERI